MDNTKTRLLLITIEISLFLMILYRYIPAAYVLIS